LKKETIVLLHGWGCDSNSWQPISESLQSLGEVLSIDLPGFGKKDVLNDFALDSIVELIAAQIPNHSVLIGWSLGGMLAVQIAARYPSKVSRLITLATNVKFVVSDDYACAMPQEVNSRFNSLFENDSEAALKLFAGLLAQGDRNERVLLRKTRSLIGSGSINRHWSQALELLARLDNRRSFSALIQSGLHVFGEFDALVPVDASVHLAALNNKQQVRILPGTAHALHWSRPDEVMQLIRDFLQSSQKPVLLSANALEKKRVARSFSRAANTYDGAADFQRNVGKKLLEKIDHLKSAQVVLDLGCGTGHFSGALQSAFPGASIVGIDLAEGMLKVAQERNVGACHWVCGDAESLPVASASVDIIFSSLALQWCQDLPELFSELNRVLKPGGALFFSTLGPNTLHELKSAWSAVDSYVHVNGFKSMQELGDSLRANDFSIISCESDTVVLGFEKLVDLTRDLKALGAHNVNPGQLAGLTGRKKIDAFKSAYENFRCHSLLPATYDVFYLASKKASNI
jgi:malonyl-CoA O-methyltransferase